MKVIFDIDRTLTDYRTFVKESALPFFVKKYGMKIINDNELEIEDILGMQTFFVEKYSCTEEVIKDENVKRILAEAVKLETPYKEVFYMKSLGDMPYSTIADVFGKTENWARVTYFRAKKQIEERMNEDE